MKDINIVKLLKEFDKVKLNNLVFIYGKEEYLKRQLINLLKNKYKDINLLWGDEIGLKDLKSVFSSGALFINENIVILRNFEAFLKNLNKNELKEFTDWIIKLTGNNKLFIFSSEEKLPSKEPYKTIKTASTIVVSTPLSLKGFIATLEKRFKKEGKNISKEDIEYLASLLKNDLTHAKHEIDKLILYTQDKNEITREDIDKIIIPKLEENIFAFINDFFLKKEDILIRYQKLIEMGYHPFEIQSYIFNQLNKILLYKELQSKGFSENEIFNKIGIKLPFQKAQLKNQAKFNKLEELIQLLKSLYRLEIRQKVYFENPEKSLEKMIINWLE